MLNAGLVLLSLLIQTEAKPLPDVRAFLAELRKSLHTDDHLLSSYTYTEKRTRVELDSNRRPKKTEVNVFQVYPGTCERPAYRRQIIKNGKPVPEKELAKQDREHQQRVKEGRQDDSSRGPRWRRRESCDGKVADERIIQDLFGLYDIRIVGRETISGHSAVLVTFNPRPTYEPQTEQGMMLQHISGRAWISESDYQLVRVSAEVFDDIPIVGIGLAKLRKGTRLAAERRRFNGEVWLPAKAEVELEARVLLRGVRFRETIEYSDHKKFSVDTILRFPEGQ
jgi:hypothetical protein